MKLHIIFQGGPVDGLLTSIVVGGHYDQDPPTELRVANAEKIDFDLDKVQGHVYRLIDASESVVTRQFNASYQYSHDYNDLPVSLVDHLFDRRNK